MVFIFAALAFGAGAFAQSPAPKTDAGRERAVALWEEAVRAKGGRERLRSVRSLLVSSTIDVEAPRGSNVTETERLYAMPGKAWVYTRTPAFDVSLDVTVINHERDLCAVTLAPARADVPQLSGCIPTTPIEYLLQDPVIYLMETSWVRPVPVRTRTERKGSKKIEVIETEVGLLRVDFYLDPKTRLPARLVTDWTGQPGMVAGLLRRETIELEDYADVDGILMPRRVTRVPRDFERPVGGVGRRDTERARYRFNVEYNPAIFDAPASRRVKPGDWQQR